MRHKLSAHKTLLVRGPAIINLVEGHASILAAPLNPNHPTHIPKQKQLPVEAESETILEITRKQPGGNFEVEGSTIPVSWRAAANALHEMREGRVIVIGAADVGKSTLSAYLTNHLLAQGHKVQLVDADIGQADVGPPTTIANALPNRPITSLNDLSPTNMLFIGTTSPPRVESKLINGVEKLSTDANSAVTIINTDGWVNEPNAIFFKTRMINSLHPNLVLGLARRRELQPILSSTRAESMIIDSAKQVLPRSRRNRREIRFSGYRRYLEGGKTTAIPLRELQLSTPQGFPGIRSSRIQELYDLIVGFTGEDGYLIQIGIFGGTEDNMAYFFCRGIASLRRVEFGYVRLSVSGRETGYI